MNKSLAFKNKFYLFLLLILSFFIFAYLFYFLINGERGIVSFYKLKKINLNHEYTLSNLDKKNYLLSDRIKRLQTKHIDLDFVEEKIRKITGYKENDELLLIFD